MKVNESKEKELNLVSGTIQMAQRGISFAKENLDTLNMEDDPDEEGIEQELYDAFPCVDPTMFMTQKEEVLWNRLSKQKKEYFIKKGMDVAEHTHTPEARGHASSELFRESIHRDEQVKLFYQMRQEKEIDLQENISGGKFFYQRNPEIKNGEVSDRAAQVGNVSEYASGVIVEGAAGNKQEVFDNSVTGNGINVNFSNPKTVTEFSVVTKTTEAATVGTGMGLAVEAGKKAAEAFRRTVESQEIVSEKVRSSQQGTESLRTWDPLLDSPIVKGGATIVATLTALLSAVVQTVTSFLTSVMSALLSVVLVIVPIISLIGILIALFSVILSGNTSNNGAEQIVRVALEEEGNTDGTQYWEFTMNSNFVDGDVTPWCACFVSWCADQCGYIDDGLFPKSGSVLTYRIFYQERNLYQESGDYIPSQGDLIIFGSDEHIGIVQYTEDERVITIEGNAPDMVHSWSYSLDSSYITGYCTPQYPQEADFTGDTNAEIAYNYFCSMGCTPETSVAILGNLRAESGIDPNCYQLGGGPGRGICQWEEGGGRFEALIARAEAEGKEWNDLEVQLEFLWYELNGGDATCAYILNRDYGGIENFKNATDIAWAVEAFEASFERAGVPAIEQRTAYAQEFYEQFAE